MNLTPDQLLQKALDLDAAGDANQALWLLREALRLKPQWAEARVVLGIVLFNRGLFADACAQYQKANAINSCIPASFNNLGNALLRLGQFDEAARSFERAIQLKPDYTVAHTNLGNARRDQGRLEESILLHHKALSLDPSLAAAYNNLATVLLDLGRPDEAIQNYEKAVALGATPDVHGSLAGAHLDAGNTARATEGFLKTLKLQPHDVDNHLHLGMAYLLQGEFQRGWPEYEWRHKRPGRKSDIELAMPRWDGSPLQGKSILLHSEQGFGDTIHMARYAALVAQRGGKVVLRCQKALVSLMKTAGGIQQVIGDTEPVVQCDVQCPLMSLPAVFNTNIDTIPASVPYLRADATKVAEWLSRLGNSPNLRVGYVWAGSPTHKKDRLRSIKLDALAPLMSVNGVSHYSLQKGKATEQIAKANLPIISLDSFIRDFTDTAAAIAAMDLVIAVDTSVAHLAGALGKPVWVMMPFSPDWRWLLHREDSPWYPTMRLFRQGKTIDWSEVIQRIAHHLQSFAQSRTQARAA